MEIFKENFLGLYDPFLLNGMDEAVKRIVKAVNEREKIVIYGTYYMESITGISLLLLVLKYLNADVDYIIPDQTNEMDDLNPLIIKNHIKFLGTKLLITTGCGMNSYEEVELCKSLGIDVIITDNKKSDVCKKTPNTVIINPNLPNCHYPFKGLAVTGVVYKLTQAISEYYQMKCLKKYLDLVMIGTLSSNAPLVDENVVLVNEGIDKFKYTNNYGLKAIEKFYGLEDIEEESLKKLFSTVIPAGGESLNGKVNNARIAVELFTTVYSDRAEQIAKYFLSQVCK